MEMKGEFRRISAKALNFVVLVALPLMIFFMLFAEQSICFLTGGTLYESATLPMQIIMPTLLFIGITNVLGIQILVPLGREKTVLVSEIVGAVTDLILNAILIPLYGAAGAAIGTLAAEFAVLVVQYIALRSEVCGAFLDIHYFKIFAALIPAVLSAVWVSHLQIGTFWLLLLAAVLFFGLYGIVLLLLKEPLVHARGHHAAVLDCQGQCGASAWLCGVLHSHSPGGAVGLCSEGVDIAPQVKEAPL